MRIEVTKRTTTRELKRVWARLTVGAPDTWITDPDGERHLYVHALRKWRECDIIAEEHAHELRILTMIEAIEGMFP